MSDNQPAQTLAYRDPFEDGAARRSTVWRAAAGAGVGFIAAIGAAVAAVVVSLDVVPGRLPIWPIGAAYDAVGVVGLFCLAYVWPRRGQRPFVAGILVACPIVLVVVGLGFYPVF